MWPNTILPSAVAGPVAAKALQCSACSGLALGDFGSRKDFVSRPVGSASKAALRHDVSSSELAAAISTRSRDRPKHLAFEDAAPSAIPFISSRYSGSYLRRKSALTSVRVSFQV